MTANLGISSRVHPKNSTKLQHDVSFWLQGTYRAVWSLPLTFFACARSLPDHVEGTFTAFQPRCCCQESARERAGTPGAASQRATGTAAAVTGKYAKLGAGASPKQGLSEIRLCKAGGG